MRERNSSKEPADPARDAELVARARDGDRAAFDELVLRHEDRVFNMALRMLGNADDALDLAQEVFLSAYRALKGFESKALFSTWLYRVTVNHCRDEMRRRATVKHTRPRPLGAGRDADDPPADPPARAASPFAAAAARESHEIVAAAVAALPDDAKEALVLRDVEGLPYEEIAEILDVPLGTVRSRIHRARSLVRERLREAGVTP
ncbi:MAG TPA: sigma-70 family RNA polymerase sigma factor [Planctomycetota bacterium]|nr:sigma-70 family RNA polymerase sigma factor [Planctomycetota bacterium]